MATASKEAPALSVVVPAYNEEACLATVLGEIRDVLARSEIPGWEIVVVDDGSSDGTADVVETLAADDARLRLIRHARNGGQGAALATGFQAARGSWCTWLPADGQIPAAEVPRIWALTNNADFITTHYRERNDGLVRTVLSTGLSTLIWAALGVWAFGGGVFAFRRELWGRCPPRTSTMLLGVEFRHRLKREPIRYRDLAIDCAPRLAGTSKSANLRTIRRTFEALLRIRMAS